MEQHLIVAFAVDALAAKLEIGDVLVRYPVAGSFTAAVVIIPLNLNSRALQDIQHAFLMVRQLFIIVGPRHIREHARYRNRGRGAAGRGVGEIDNIILFQARVGLAGVAVQGKSLPPLRFRLTPR